MKLQIIALAPSLLVALAAALPVLATLQQGAHAPDFAARASLAGKEQTFSLKDARAKGPVVVYFYPSAYTGGCNLQAHTFAERRQDFEKAGASIVGVSLDSIARLNDFSKDPEYCAGHFPVVSDADGKVAKSFDVAVREAAPGKQDTRGVEIDHGFAERATFVVAKDGTIAAVIAGVAPAENVEQALAAVQKLPAAKGH